MRLTTFYPDEPMQKSAILTLFFFLSFTTSFAFSETSHLSGKNRTAQLSKISPTNVRKLLIFATLYPDTPEAKEALSQAWSILSQKKSSSSPRIPPQFEQIALECIHLVEPDNHRPPPPDLSRTAIEYIHSIGSHLPNRKLQGYTSSSLDEVASLTPKEIDLVKALLLLEEKETTFSCIEASLDLLALEILASIGPHATFSEKVSALNTLLFHEMTFRYPPLSAAHENIAQFSELSSVLSSRKGICLGTSILYLCLAQRLDLPLTIFTPPGHIFLGYTTNAHIRVIETTARGVAFPLDSYLGITLRHVPSQDMKSAVGMVAFNKAGEFLQKNEWQEALDQYRLAKKFDNSESVLKMMALCELLLGNKTSSQRQAKELLKNLPEYSLEHDILLIDLSQGTLSPKVAQAFMKDSSNKKENLPERIKTFEHLLKESPKSQIVALHLANLWNEYGKTKEAIPLVESVAIGENTPLSIHYYLSHLYFERCDLVQARLHANKALEKAKKGGLVPKPLGELIRALQEESPDCADPSLLIYKQVHDSNHIRSS